LTKQEADFLINYDLMKEIGSEHHEGLFVGSTLNQHYSRKHPASNISQDIESFHQNQSLSLSFGDLGQQEDPIYASSSQLTSKVKCKLKVNKQDSDLQFLDQL